ncbi:erythromycin esterase family protein [Stomatobaculum longum]|uniref:erythromycin esterase family protein n=1 Tax=Stomatobaculum longum TaxID=796942 RepID=UPI002803D686|nr:erythromycin esterase family protein [Stomatobaculum longum]
MRSILKKIRQVCVRLLLGLILLLLGIALFCFGKQKIEEVQAHREIPELRAEMQSLSADHIPANVSVLAIGEAVHGSREFQKMKLSVLREMVEKQGYTAFALEADYSECADINRYLQSGEGKPEELVQKFSFPIYHTKEMAELLGWIQDWNRTAPEEKKVRFYGFDMQNPETGYAFLKQYSLAHGLATEAEFDAVLGNVLTPPYSLSPESAGQAVAFLNRLKEKASTADMRDADARDFQMELTTVRQAMESQTSTEDFNTLRDRDMAENVEAIRNIEAEIGSGKLVISAHDGHIERENPIYTSMGVLLSQDIGNNYYAIGTDVWKVRDNMKCMGEAKRSIQSFVSCDPLAAQARFAAGQQYVLYFSEVSDEKSQVYTLVHTPMRMMQLGEGYTFLMRLLPDRSYRLQGAPAACYDAMLFLYEAHPIEILKGSGS